MSTGTFTDRQIRQRRMVRDQLLRADRTVCHFPAAEPGEGPYEAWYGGDRGISMYHLPSVNRDASNTDTRPTRREFNRVRKVFRQTLRSPQLKREIAWQVRPGARCVEWHFSVLDLGKHTIGRRSLSLNVTRRQRPPRQPDHDQQPRGLPVRLLVDQPVHLFNIERLYDYCQ